MRYNLIFYGVIGYLIMMIPESPVPPFLALLFTLYPALPPPRPKPFVPFGQSGRLFLLLLPTVFRLCVVG